MRAGYRGVVLLMLVAPGAGAWTQGGTGGDVDIGGTIDPSGPVNPWQVQVGSGIGGLNMVMPEGGKLLRHRLKSSIPVLGLRPGTGIGGTFRGETAGGIAPQITYKGLVSNGAFEKGRLPVELDVIRDRDGKIMGWLRLNLLAGAEVSQTGGGTGRRYSVYASQPGEAFYGGVGRTPNEALDNALQTIGDVFPPYASRYNTQGINGVPGQKQAVEFRNNNMEYSGFYGAGLLAGDDVVMRMDEGYESQGEETWQAALSITIKYL